MNIYIPVDILSKISVAILVVHTLLMFWHIRIRHGATSKFGALLSIVLLYLAPIAALFLAALIF